MNLFRFVRQLGLMFVMMGMLTSCSLLQQLQMRPSARIAGAHLEGLSLEQTKLVFDVEIKNPYSFELPMAGLDYKLASGEQQLVAGNLGQGKAIPAQGTGTLAVPVELKFADLLKALPMMKLGSVVPYKADLGLNVDAGALGKMNLPMSHEGKVPIPAPPTVAFKGATWDKVGLTGVAGRVTFGITNPNQFPFDLSSMNYGLSLEGANLVNSQVAQPMSFAAGGANDLGIDVSFNPMSLGGAVLQMVKTKSASYKLAGTMKLATEFAPLEVPYSQEGKLALK